MEFEVTERTRFSVSLDGPDAGSVVAQGVEAERQGFDVVWMADHLSDLPPGNSIFDAWTILAHLGAKTKRVMLASGVTDTQRMHPAKAASTVATLDNLSGGRAILGIGAGEVMNTRPFGIEWETRDARVRRLREYIEVAIALWSSSFEKPKSYDGEFYSIKNAHLALRPVQRPHPRVYVGAFASDYMLRMVGELADGWFPGAFYTPDAYAEKVKIIREAAKNAGRTSESLDFVIHIPIVFGTDAATRAKVKRAFRGALVRNRYMLKLLGAHEAYDFVSKELQYQLIEPTPSYVNKLNRTIDSLPISNDLLERGIDEMMAIGDVDDCIDAIKRFTTVGATHVSMSAFLADSKAYETFANSVLPALATP